MQVNVKLFATLRDGRFKTDSTELADNSRVSDVMNKFDIPVDDVAICLINGRDADKDQILQNGDTVSLFPPVGGG